MHKIDEAIDRIKILECPTGELESRVAEILKDYGVRDGVSVYRDESFDNNEAQGYRVEVAGEGHPFIVLAKSGYDDYVAKVTDVYSRL